MNRLGIQGRVVGAAVVAVLFAGLMLWGLHLLLEHTERRDSQLATSMAPVIAGNGALGSLDRIQSLLRAASDRASALDSLVGPFSRLRESMNRIAEAGVGTDPIHVLGLWRRYAAALVRVSSSDLERENRSTTLADSIAIGALLRSALQEFVVSSAVQARDLARGPATPIPTERRALVIGAAGLVFAVLLLTLTVYRAGNRIKRLRRTAARLADGDHRVPVLADGADDLGAITLAFETLRVHLLEGQDALRATEAELQRMVAERTETLRDSRAHLRAQVERGERTRKRLRLLSEAIEQNDTALAVANVSGEIEYANAAFRRQRRPDGRGIHRLYEDLLVPEVLGTEVCESLPERIDSARPWSAEHERLRTDGRTVWEHIRVMPLVDRQGEIEHLAVTIDDISERKQQEHRILHQALHDPLTGLPNRTHATNDLSEAIHRARSAGAGVSLLFVDFDDFRKVNDSLGHEVGDELLIQIAARLRDCLGSNRLPARSGGDEFLVIHEVDDADAGDAALAARILTAFAAPFLTSGNDIAITPSVGIARYPEHGRDAVTLMRNAELALYEAKDKGRNTWRLFTPEAHDSSVRRLNLERDIREGIANDEFHLVYQPLLDARTGRINGAEALLRWQRPDSTYISPGVFIDVAERTGTIVGLGAWALKTACRQAAEWQPLLGDAFHMSVNVSVRQLWDDSIVDVVRAALGESGLAARSLQLEITETALIRNTKPVERVLRALHALGVSLAMDDFGTGYSSLSYLKNFPFDTLKIDGSFVRDLTEDADDRALVRASINLGCELGLHVVAEGVENHAQQRFLRDTGCHSLQGYLFGRPLTAPNFERRWIRPVAAQTLPDTGERGAGGALPPRLEARAGTLSSPFNDPM